MSLLGLLNFVLLQWFCVRLQVSFSRVCPPGTKHRWWDREIPAEDKVEFGLLRWVWPLTGWSFTPWPRYRFVTNNVRGS